VKKKTTTVFLADFGSWTFVACSDQYTLIQPQCTAKQ